MTYNKENRKDYNDGNPDWFILFVKIKDHKTWRVVAANRQLKNLEKNLSNTHNVTDQKVMRVDGQTLETSLLDI